MKYRPEVDGLRAVAVISVILFHAGVAVLPGGFLGVDVFFVVSGYLITGLLVGELNAGTFSLASFYERRVRRIIPALNVMMLLCIPVALVLLLPDDLENFGQSLVATAAFGNNVLLMLTSGYFELEVAFKPLMHTWSLGAEEHYYLAIPLLLSGAYLLGKRRGAFAATLIVGLASLAFCLWASRSAPVANFYLIFSRGWELAAGGLTVMAEPRLRASFSPRRRLAQSAAVIGAGMIVAPLFLLDNTMSLPGLLTLIPVVGTCLVLALDRPDTWSGRLLAARPLVAVGLLSYSAYLYHQPIFAFARVVSLAEPSTVVMVLLIAPVFALAWLSWRCVERPFRDRRRTSFRSVAIFAVATSVLIVAAGLAMHLTSGFVKLRPELASAGQDLGSRQNARYNEAPLRFAERTFSSAAPHPRVLVIGNSFARDFINMGLESGHLAERSLSYAQPSDCSLKQVTLDTARQADFVVFSISGSPRDYGCVDAQMQQISGVSGARLFVLGTKNFGWNNNAVMLLPRSRRYSYRVLPLPEVAEANALARRHFGAAYVDILGSLADAQGRVPVFTPDHRFISQDREHLTKAGAAYIGSILFRDTALREIAKPQPAGPLFAKP